MHYFYSETTMIERSSKAMSATLVCQGEVFSPALFEAELSLSRKQHEQASQATKLHN